MSVVERLKRIDPAWRTALTVFVVMRLTLTAWSLVILALFPVTVQNLDLYGAPVLAALDLATGERFAYGRDIGATTLVFRPGERGYVVDAQSGSRWSLSDRKAVAGGFAGALLQVSDYTTEEVFPYRGVSSTLR